MVKGYKDTSLFTSGIHLHEIMFKTKKYYLLDVGIVNKILDKGLSVPILDFGLSKILK